MTTLIIKNEFSWENQSWREWLWSPSTAKALIDTIDQPETPLKAIAYLADHSHGALEQKLTERASTLTPKDLQDLCSFAFASGRLKMIEVCQRLLNFATLKKLAHVEDARASAQREALFTPKPLRKIEALSNSILQETQRYSRFVLNSLLAVNYSVLMAAFGTVYSLLMSVLSIFNHPPSSIYDILNYIQFIKETYAGIFPFWEFIYSRYQTLNAKFPALLAGAVALTFLTGIYLIGKKLRINAPKRIDYSLLFTNASQEAEEGKIQKLQGRVEEKAKVRQAWDVAKGEKYRFALLVGPTGCGKTEFVKGGLAWDSVYDPLSFVYRKKIFIVNTLQLVKAGDEYLDSILQTIKGQEDDVVLFFDESHAAAASENGPMIGPKNSMGFVELLKTKLLDHNIRCIFATTPEEFEETLAPNKPFLDRSKQIPFNELPEDDTINVLKDKVALDEKRCIEVDPDAYEAIVAVGRTAEQYKTRANPRKAIDIYKDIMSLVDNWSPQLLNKQLEGAIKAHEQKVDECRRINKNPAWVHSPEGKDATTVLLDQKKQIAELEQKIAKQNQQLQALTSNRKLMPVYRTKYQRSVHDASKETSSLEDLAHYLFLKHILTPALNQAIEGQVRNFHKDYQEEVPLRLDANFVLRSV